MDAVTISPKFQMIVTKDIWNSLKLNLGQKVQAIAYDSRVELTPKQPIREMQGFLKGINTDVPCEKNRI